MTQWWMSWEYSKSHHNETDETSGQLHPDTKNYLVLSILALQSDLAQIHMRSFLMFILFRKKNNEWDGEGNLQNSKKTSCMKGLSTKELFCGLLLWHSLSELLTNTSCTSSVQSMGPRTNAGNFIPRQKSCLGKILVFWQLSRAAQYW